MASPLQHHQLRAFLLTFVLYALLHMSRESIDAVKPYLVNSWCDDGHPHAQCSDANIGQCRRQSCDSVTIMNTIFMFSYAAGLIVLGTFADRMDLRKWLVYGVGLSCVFIVAFALGYFLPVNSVNHAWYYYLIWGMSGLAQSFGWPGAMALLGNWFSKEWRGLIFGLWASCRSVGNILGGAALGSVVSASWYWTPMIAAIVLIIWGLIIYFFLVAHPRHQGFSLSDGSRGVSQYLDEEEYGIDFFKGLVIPGVLLWTIIYSCVKFVNYGLMLWLPSFLFNTFGIDDKSFVNHSYDIGQIVGGALAGWISDHCRGRRSVVVIIFLTVAAASMPLYRLVDKSDVNGLVALLLLTGMFLGGPANLIVSAVVMDLSKHHTIRKNCRAVGTISGIMDGTAAGAAAAGQYLVFYFERNNGSSSTFMLLIIVIIVGIALSLPMVATEFKELWREHKQYHAMVPEEDAYYSDSSRDHLATPQ